MAGLPPRSGVELAGFVDDLGAEYAAAAVALVPVLQGAGVKFKTVEALLPRRPGGHDDRRGRGNRGQPSSSPPSPTTADGLALAIVDVLVEPLLAQTIADRSQAWAHTEFHRQRFIEQVLASWTG